jgi:hypothetical protein
MRWVMVLLVACGDNGAVPADGAPADTMPPDGLPILCDQDLPEATPVGAAEPVSLADCGNAPRHASPTRGCRLDLRAHAPGAQGTCATDTTIEIAQTQLPLVIDLPEGTTDATCAPACQRVGEPLPARTFGLRVRVVQPPQGGPFISMRVDPPWGLVAGNECDPSLCADGFPSVNEFGQPLACVFSYCREIGVITDDPAPPPARLTLLEDQTSNEFSNCCLFPVE